MHVIFTVHVFLSFTQIHTHNNEPSSLWLINVKLYICIRSSSFFVNSLYIERETE